MASVSALCTQVENYSFPDNRTFVSVLDQGDVAITDFKTGNFSVVENGLPTVVTEAKKVNNAADILYTVIVIDQSGSMGSDLNDAKTAAIAYVNAMGANDYAEVILFSDVVLLKQTFTNDKALLIAAINDTVYGPATAFYDAVVTGVHELNARVGRKTVLALTDGYDNASIETEATTIIETNKGGIACFTVGLNPPAGGFSNLTNIANLTGGKSYQTSTPSELTGIFQKVLYRMQNLMEVHFRSRIGEVKKDDNTREMTVYLNFGPALSTSCKKTYGY